MVTRQRCSRSIEMRNRLDAVDIRPLDTVERIRIQLDSVGIRFIGTRMEASGLGSADQIYYAAVIDALTPSSPMIDARSTFDFADALAWAVDGVLIRRELLARSVPAEGILALSTAESGG